MDIDIKNMMNVTISMITEHLDNTLREHIKWEDSILHIVTAKNKEDAIRRFLHTVLINASLTMSLNIMDFFIERGIEEKELDDSDIDDISKKYEQTWCELYNLIALCHLDKEEDGPNYFSEKLYEKIKKTIDKYGIFGKHVFNLFPLIYEKMSFIGAELFNFIACEWVSSKKSKLH